MFVEQKEGGVRNFITGPVVVNNVLINPTLDEAKEYGINWIQNEPVYIGEVEYDGVKKKFVDIVVYAKEIETGTILNWKFKLVAGDKLSKSGKTQYINYKGVTSWVEDPKDLPSWFVTGDYRKALAGEEELYKFIIAFNNFNVGTFDTTDSVLEDKESLQELFKGNFNDLKFANTLIENKVTVVAYIQENDEGDKFYNRVWNKEFFRHWEKTPYLYESKEKKGRVEWEYYINHIVNVDPNNRFDPDLITPELKVWTSDEVKLALDKKKEEIPNEIPNTSDDLPF